MNSKKCILTVVGFFIVLLISQSPISVRAEDFFLSIKGWQATLIRLEGVNTSKALAVGQVRYQNAKEYCERDPGGITKRYGGRLTNEQCIQEVLRQEQGKLYSASADCPRKILLSHIGSFTLIGQTNESGFRQNLWRNNVTGQILDGSNASGAPLLDSQFQLLCPAFMNR
jgi:hypothetical protein